MSRTLQQKDCIGNRAHTLFIQYASFQSELGFLFLALLIMKILKQTNLYFCEM